MLSSPFPHNATSFSLFPAGQRTATIKISFTNIINIYFNICYNNVKRYGKRFLSRIFADNFILTLKDSTLKNVIL